jgi:hypothetical protein
MEMIRRLRYLLDSRNGDSLPRIYNPAREAYSLGKNRSLIIDSAGVYTFGHVAGYGLLYNLTGDKHYADLGRQCFELALAGQRDRDDRYSWVKPGGALRAGPALGWYAMGYDLCYNGWDEATRERFGKAIADYNAGIEQRDAKALVTLDALAAGTMPPKSNHFGMQVGGAALALMAVSGEKWVDKPRVDSLLRICEISMIRNVTEGFGDGGFFTEGDGTGSMSSQTTYLTAIQAWKNAMGMDFVNVVRPNVRMTVLKWLYLTIVRDGSPDFWPIRGAYPENVWDRQLSGGGYFSLGFGAVTDDQKAAIKWFYNNMLMEHDRKRGAPYEPSMYPHLSVCAFVNWPLDLPERSPGMVLPLCYRDSIHGFYAWRNRWRDENDIVVSILTRTTRGYMSSRADTSLRIAAFGEKFSWGSVRGDVKYWHHDLKGETSVMTMTDGTSLAVDFSGTSGAEAMLVTTGKAEGTRVVLGNNVLTFRFITTGEKPRPLVDNGKIIAGKQSLYIRNGNIHLEETE